MIVLDRFIEIIAPLGKAFKPLDELQVEVWFNRLNGEDEKKLRLTVEYLLDHHRFSSFPLIEEFKEAIDHIKSGDVEGSEEDYSFLDRIKCGRCGGEGRYLVYFDEHKNEVGGERRNERTVHVVARFCSCPFGQRIAAVQGERNQRLRDKRRKRWIEPGEDREDATPF